MPIGAVTGPLAAVVSRSVRSLPTKPIAILPPPPPEPNTELSPVPSAPQMETGTSRTKAFVDARRAVTFSFRVSGDAPDLLAVELVRASDGSAVKTWNPVPRAGRRDERLLERPDRVRRRAAGALLVPAHRLRRQRRDGAQRRRWTDDGRDAFDLYDNMFPVRGRHDFGGSQRRLRLGPRGPQPPGPGRVRPLRHAAGGRARRPGEVQAVPRGRGPLPRDRRRRHGRGLRLHAPGRGRRPSRPATASTPASGSARWATRATPAAATSTSSSGAGPAGTTAGSPSTRCPSLRAWDAWS